MGYSEIEAFVALAFSQCTILESREVEHTVAPTEVDSKEELQVHGLLFSPCALLVCQHDESSESKKASIFAGHREMLRKSELRS
jgi:hypothetical protein